MLALQVQGVSAFGAVQNCKFFNEALGGIGLPASR